MTSTQRVAAWNSGTRCDGVMMYAGAASMSEVFVGPKVTPSTNADEQNVL